MHVSEGSKVHAFFCFSMCGGSFGVNLLNGNFAPLEIGMGVKA